MHRPEKVQLRCFAEEVCQGLENYSGESPCMHACMNKSLTVPPYHTHCAADCTVPPCHTHPATDCTTLPHSPCCWLYCTTLPHSLCCWLYHPATLTLTAQQQQQQQQQQQFIQVLQNFHCHVIPRKQCHAIQEQLQLWSAPHFCAALWQTCGHSRRSSKWTVCTWCMWVHQMETVGSVNVTGTILLFSEHVERRLWVSLLCLAVCYHNKRVSELVPDLLHSSVGRASHRYHGCHGFESRWSLRFFSALFL